MVTFYSIGYQFAVMILLLIGSCFYVSGYFIIYKDIQGGIVMMKLYYSVKAILKHRVSMVVFSILILINFFSMVGMMKNDLSNSLENKIREYRTDIYQSQVQLDNLSALDLSKTYYTDAEIGYLKNFFSMNQWIIDGSRKELELLEAGEGINDAKLVHDLIREMSLMDYVMDESAGHEYSLNVFAEEIERYADKLNITELPFDFKTLHLHPYINDYLSSQQRDDNYQTSKKMVEYYFYLMDNDLPDIEIDTLSPWSYLMKQVGADSIVPFLTFPLAIIFAAVYLYDLKQKDSFKLLLTQGTDRSLVVFNQTLALSVSFIIIYLTSLLIPLIVLGIKCGWQGLTLPILTDTQGLFSFTMFEHLDYLNVFKLSTFPAKCYIHSLSSYYFIPDAMVYIGLWKVLLISGGLAMLKFSAAVCIGSMCVFIARKNWQTFVVLSVFMIVYIISQSSTVGVLSQFNIFDLRSSLLIVQGCTHITTLHAICICLISLLTVSGISILFFRSNDYDA